MVFSPIEVNTYILGDDSGDCIIIDCGCFTGREFEKLEALLSANCLNPLLLLNTHCHLDHVFGSHFLLSKYGILPRYNELEEENRKNVPVHSAKWGLNVGEPPAAGSFIIHGEIITLGRISLKALFVPGHTAGSLAFYSEADGCVFTGDALFAGSIGRTDLPGGNFETLISSIRENLLNLPPGTVVYSGHGPETTIEREMRSNPYLI